MPHRKPELDRIIKDLKVFVADACKYDPERPNDFVSDMCDDAGLILEKARDELNEKDPDKVGIKHD